MSDLRLLDNREDWDALVCQQGAHPLQLWGWGEVKALHGPWQPHRLWMEDLQIGAQVLVRKLPAPFRSLAYVPRGPFGAGLFEQAAEDFTASERCDLLLPLCTWARSLGCIELKIEPHWPATAGLPQGFRASANEVLVSRTAVLNLGLGKDELLAAATKKTRQYIRKSEKDGITVREVFASTAATDVAQSLAIYQQTAARAGFGIHRDEYYYDIVKELASRSRLFVAEHEGSVVAFLWLIVSPTMAFELYGGMNDRGQQLRANYTLKWQAISQLCSEGVALYDMNGLLNDGISTFKLGFSGGAEVNLVGTLDAPLSPLSGIWEGLLPKAKGLLKHLGKHR